MVIPSITPIELIIGVMVLLVDLTINYPLKVPLLAYTQILLLLHPFLAGSETDTHMARLLSGLIFSELGDSNFSRIDTLLFFFLNSLLSMQGKDIQRNICSTLLFERKVCQT